MGKFSFRKAERLSKEKDIQELFDKGSSFYLFPFKVLTMPVPDQTGSLNQILISVSRRNFKRAVDRNRIKRQIREAYRLNKHLLSSGSPRRIGLLYTHKQTLASREIFAKMVHVINRICKVSHNSSPSS